MSREITKRKDVAIAAAKEAGGILLRNFKKPIKATAKGDRNFVTEIDIKADNAIIKRIRENFPEDNIFSEESRSPRTKSPFNWILDPLDGTHNYMHGIDTFGTSIAVEFEKEVVIGVIHMPLADELHSAVKGEGAYCNGKKIKVSQRPLREATLVFDSSIRYNKKPMLEALGRLVDKVFNVRMFGSSAQHLADIAKGKIEIDVEFHDKVWDFAAGLLLIEEAGGKCTDFKGNKWSAATKGYIASNGVVHQDIIKLLEGLDG